MPTAAKIVGAVLFAALAYFVTDLMKPTLPEGTQVGLFSPINAFFGFIMGWRLIGARAGNGLYAAFGSGLTAAAATFFWCLLFWGGHQMLDKSIKLRYSDPTEALTDMASMMMEDAVTVSNLETLGALIVGSFLVAWLTEGASRRWA
ncbi:MAG: TrgA family protein [Rhodobacteraceae bacterium]|nr:TrgA family protein [Paracoccaceae bacterium]